MFTKARQQLSWPIFSTAPKIAAVVVLANVMFTTFGPSQSSWQGIIAIISALSMVIGAFGALAQNNIKRILAYSSISNVGFALIGVAAGEKFGASSVLVYMTIYVIATLGMFGGVLALRRNGIPLEDISDLNGLAKSKPGMAFGLLDADVFCRGHTASRRVLGKGAGHPGRLARGHALAGPDRPGSQAWCRSGITFGSSGRS